MFTTARLFTKEKAWYYYKTNHFDIVIKDMLYCKAEKVSMRICTFDELSEELCRFDADCSKEELYKFLERMYKNKPEWKGIKTPLIVLFLLKKS